MTKEEIRAEAIRVEHDLREERANIMREIHDRYKSIKQTLVDECLETGGHNYRPAYYLDETALQCQWCKDFIIVSYEESERILDKQKTQSK